MNIRRYVAPSAREALRMARAELGAEAIVLKNRSVPGGVEIVAMADESATSGPVPATEAAPPQSERDETMSTVSFESYVRERQQRRRRLADDDGATRPEEPRDDEETVAAAATAQPAEAPRPVCRPATRPEPAAPTFGQSPGEARSDPAGMSDRIDAQALMAEMRAMRGVISDQIESMTWFEGVRRRPVQSRMLRQLLQWGFSASLARTLVHHLPADFDDQEAGQWLREALVRNLRVESCEQTIFDSGGTYALVGPTGVGKTTTAAKIAAQFALKHGAQSVGLITADVYRIGAQDQLRTFGRLLGVPVHVAHDVVTLADFLQLFMNRKLILIDTAGVGQRDERVQELLAALSSTQVRKVVVVNAAMQAEAIEEVVDAYQARSGAGIVLSKVDEAVQLGSALDCMIRNRLRLLGVADGQRVPEDWHRPDSRSLVERALAAFDKRRAASFSFEEAEVAMLLAGARARAGGVEARSV